MKALIGFVSLALGAAVIAVILKIQTDPFAFTSYTPAAIGLQEPPAAAEPAPAQRAEHHVITLAAVTIVGHLTRPARPVGHASLHASVQSVRAEPKVKVVPAPCVDGQYRKLEPGRGVRLMCPH